MSRDTQNLTLTCWNSKGQLKEEQCLRTWFWTTEDPWSRYFHLKMPTSETDRVIIGNQHLLTVQIQLVKNQQTTIISANSPTLKAEDEEFLCVIWHHSSVLNNGKIILSVDFNAIVVKDHYRLWTAIISKESIGKANINGTFLFYKWV